MSDAIALFRPKNKSMILPFLDLDDSEESDGIYAEELDDGSFLLHTFQPFEVFEKNPNEARAWLMQFGQVLPEVHEDSRGLLFFSDDDEPEATTYDAVVKEIGDGGVWIAMGDVVLDDDDEDDDDAEFGDDAGADFQQMLAQMMGGAGGAAGAAPGGMPPIDMDMLQKFAGQLMGNVDEGGAPKGVSSFEVGQMFEQMQRGLMDTLTAEAAKQQGEPGEPGEPGEQGEQGEVIDEEFAADPDARKDAKDAPKK